MLNRRTSFFHTFICVTATMLLICGYSSYIYAEGKFFLFYTLTPKSLSFSFVLLMIWGPLWYICVTQFIFKLFNSGKLQWTSNLYVQFIVTWNMCRIWGRKFVEKQPLGWLRGICENQFRMDLGKMCCEVSNPGSGFSLMMRFSICNIKCSDATGMLIHLRSFHGYQVHIVFGRK
jgi:hypothetical protein